MKINELQVKPKRARTRKGRGISAGKGKTAGRGTKGQNARTGASRRAGFEGGQNRLIKRLPKLRGFKSHRTPAQVVYTGQLDAIKSKKITAEVLAEAGLIEDTYHSVKLIVKGEIKTAKHVELQFASETAVEKLQKVGGSFTVTQRTKRPESTKKAEKRAKNSEKTTKEKTK
ncbi:MAG: 50S ribosomal protein L15 [Patescibacteria group bacterium]